ncbi:hypothetical protein V5F79_23615 [Xanthobacter flavus]|uniref:hypothetical protein n=1 Tax=Xanthobacter flavus TaxID=281 RepID=UPI003726E485
MRRADNQRQPKEPDVDGMSPWLRKVLQDRDGRRPPSRSASTDNWYKAVSEPLATLCFFVTFLSAWAYCTLTYGFLFGFGFGWVPAVILAAFVAAIMWLLWLPLAILLILLSLGIIA